MPNSRRHAMQTTDNGNRHCAQSDIPAPDAGTMRRKLAQGLFWVLLLNVVVKPFWLLGIEVGVQNAVGAAAYGFYFAIFNLAYIFNILLDIGVTNYNTRNIARHPHLVRKHLSGILSLKLMLFAVYLVATLTVGLLLGYSSRQFFLLLLLCFNQFLNSLILYLRSNFEGLLLFRWDSVLSVMDRVLMIVICGALLWHCHDGAAAFRIEWFVYAQTVAYLLTTLFALFALLRRVGLSRLRWNRAFSLAILRQSAPFALLVLLMAGYNRIDPILLSLLSPQGDTDAGIYAGAFRLVDALTMIAYLVSVPLLPVFARLTHRWKLSDTARRLELSSSALGTFALLMAFALAAAITCSALCQPLMQLLYRDHVDELSSVFRILVIDFIPIACTYVFGTLLTAGGHLRQLNLLALLSLAVNIGLNLLLIPRYGALGSAWASLAAQSFMAAAQMVVACRRYALRPSAAYISKMAVFALLMVLVNVVAVWLQCDWRLHLSLAVVVAGAAALALRMADVAALRQLLSRGDAQEPLADPDPRAAHNDTLQPKDGINRHSKSD